MIPVEERHTRLVAHRNRGGFLLGMSWSHEPSWTPKLTHFYLGWWVATWRTWT